jgi:hypothetical protein
MQKVSTLTEIVSVSIDFTLNSIQNVSALTEIISISI